MKRSTRRWSIAIGIVLGFIVVGKMVHQSIDTVDPLCDRVSQIRKDISHEKCVRLAHRGLLSAVLQKDGITWSQLCLR
jgi:hypothetical protein